MLVDVTRSSSFIHPTVVASGLSLAEIDELLSSSSFSNAFNHLPGSDYDDGYNDNLLWMSPHLKNWHPSSPNYMPAVPSSAYQQQQALSAHPDFYSAAGGYDPEWQSDGVTDPFVFGHSSHQNKSRQQHHHHQRALSTSTIASHATAASPNQPAPLYASNLLDPNQPRSLHSHYYPTPTHTPIQDTFMDRSLSRRSAAGNTSAPLNASHNLQKQFATALPQQQTPHSQQYPVYPMQDFPNTPNTLNGDMGERRFYTPSSLPIPRLEHSMTEACADELYNPSVTIPPSHYPSNPHMNQSLLQPGGVQQRIMQAHEARTNSPANGLKRQTSPFVEGSIENPGIFGVGPIQTAEKQRLSQKWEDDQYHQWRHSNRGAAVAQQDPPKTISPKDAYVDDFRDPAEDAAMAAFPSTNPPQQLWVDNPYRQRFGLGSGSRYPSSTFGFQPPSIPANAGMASSPADVKFPPLRRNESSSDDTPAHLVSMETSKSEPGSSQESLLPPQPQHRQIQSTVSAADAGTYSCTYAGCPQRFATPALLQRHKRDAHRSTAGHTVASRTTTQSPPLDDSRSGSPSTPLNRNSQAGPHRCDRINPSTNKPCNTVFSRPYDLTRHEDTIHARRPKATCTFCLERGEEKTFSRADALTRHLRVVHPDVEAPSSKSSKRRA